MSGRIFLDAHATTPVDPRVLEAMLPWFASPANSHSAHRSGAEAAGAIEMARGQVAALIGADADEIVFTPSASIGANIALKSLGATTAIAARSAIEHPCVTEALASMQPSLRVIELPVGEDGLVEPDSVAEAIDEGAGLVAVMAVNNEVGTVQPIAEIARHCTFAGAHLFVDLAQAAGRIPLDVHGVGAATAIVSSHKLYGPQGVGALFVRRDLTTAMRPIAHGGGQERGLSPGTLPTALCVGFGLACEIAMREMAAERKRIAGLRDRLLDLLKKDIPGLTVNGSLDERVANNLNVSLPGVDADELLAAAPDVIASTGSACSSGAVEPSRVLTAMGLPRERTESAIRFGIGRYTDVNEIDRAAALVIRAQMALNRGRGA